MKVLDYCSEETWDVLVAQRAGFIDGGGNLGLPLEAVMRDAVYKARQYVELGSAYVDHQPRNGTSYALLLHDLVAAQVRSAVAMDAAYFPDDPAMLERIEARARQKWNAHNGAAGRWGGELLVAMPLVRGSAAFGLMDFYHPTMLVDHLRLRYADAVPVAEYLTFFGSAVMRVRDGAEVS